MRYTIVKDTLDDQWYVWVHLKDGDPTELSESFIVGTGPSRDEAIVEAAEEIQKTAETLVDAIEKPEQFVYSNAQREQLVADLAAQMSPTRLRELIDLHLSVTAACQQAGIPNDVPIPDFIRGLACRRVP